MTTPTARLAVSLFALVLLAVLVVAPAAALDQDVSLPSLKAAFLANFAKFTTWPEDAMPAGRVFTFCISGDKAVADALEQSIKDRPGQEPMSVVVVTPDASLRGCQMLYLGGLNTEDHRRTLEPLKGLPDLHGERRRWLRRARRSGSIAARARTDGVRHQPGGRATGASLSECQALEPGHHRQGQPMIRFVKRWFQDLPLARKLITIGVITSAATALAACIAILAYDVVDVARPAGA